MTLAMLIPCFTVFGSIAAMHLVWWVLGDLVLEHVGIPFIDSGVPTRGRRRRATAAGHHAAVSDRARRRFDA